MEQLAAQPTDTLVKKDFILLQKVLKNINSILNTRVLLEKIVEDISKILGFDRCAILLYDEKTDQLEIAALTGWEDNSYPAGTRLNRNQGIVWKAVRESKMIYIPDVENFPDEAPCDFTSRSHVDIPLFHNGKLIGLLNAQHSEKNAFNKDDLNILTVLANHIPIALINSQMFESVESQKKHILGELMEAREVQKSLFPKNNPQLENFTFSAFCEPSFKVGGDWYDYIYFPDGRIGVAIADVAGKGLSAAILMSSARMIFRHVAISIPSPAEVLKKVNRILLPDIPTTKFVTLLYAVLDVQKNEITFSNAGHLNPVLITSEGASVFNLEPGYPIGIVETNYTEQKLKLGKGDKLFFYSDGVTDAINNNGESFEIERVLEHLTISGNDINTLTSELKRFCHPAPQIDDITMLMIESKLN